MQIWITDVYHQSQENFMKCGNMSLKDYTSWTISIKGTEEAMP